MMKRDLRVLARWLKLVLACLTLGSSVASAHITCAAPPVTVVEGRPGKPPPSALPRLEARARHPRPARSAAAPPRGQVPRVIRFRVLRPPHVARPPLFLLHRALLR